MSNRVIKDSIWSSPSLAKLSMEAQLHWPRLLLMTDDWGCFNADPAIIFGLVYPKMTGMTIKKLEILLQIYFEAGMFFRWQENERFWGYFVSWNGHQFCNATNLDDGSERQKHRRKTPEPPQKELEMYLDTYLYKKQVVNEKLEHLGTSGNKKPNPNPNPNPNPKKLLSSRTPISDEDFIQALKDNPAYKGIDIDKELAKMDAWFLTPKGIGRKKTHKFILNWINKADKEVTTGSQGYQKLSPVEQRLKELENERKNLS